MIRVKHIFSRLFGGKTPLQFVYSSTYSSLADLGTHIFPLDKYRLIYETLVRQGVSESNFLSPEPAGDEDILRVHSPKYLKKLKTERLSPSEIMTMELPYSKPILDFARLTAGGTILAAQISLNLGLSVHIGGGFHHAFPDHGEGFCIINDIAIAIEKLLSDRLISTAMVVDCDVHQGNGTARIYEKRPDVFTFSIHQMDIYPAQKARSSLDVGLWEGDGDGRYITSLRTHFPFLYEDIKPDIVFYVAGADPLAKDRLGGLNLTFDALEKRDRIIIEGAARQGIPVCILMAGGYAFDIKDTVKVHINTIKSAQKIHRRFY